MFLWSVVQFISVGIQMIGREAVKQYRIIIGTIGSVNSMFNLGFPRGHYTHIIIDEAGQVTEPELLSVMSMYCIIYNCHLLFFI